MSVKKVETVEYDPMMNFVRAFANKDEPVVIRHADLGSCLQWSVDYLSEKLNDKVVSVHSSPVPTLSFLEKNFIYKSMKFPDFMRKVSVECDDDAVPAGHEYLYLRSLGDGRRAKHAADIEKNFPEIAHDMRFEDFIPKDLFFSSILRISSMRTQIWTHYDVVDNALFQIVGHKKVVLFSPSEGDHLYLEGDKSQILDIDDPDYEKFPKFKLVTKYECVLSPGDVLYIPALWFHNTKCLSFSIGANVFWKLLPQSMYYPNDVYGNKDPVPAAEFLSLVTRGVKQLKLLPRKYQSFYAKRAIQTLEELTSREDINVASESNLQDDPN